MVTFVSESKNNKGGITVEWTEAHINAAEWLFIACIEGGSNDWAGFKEIISRKDGGYAGALVYEHEASGKVRLIKRIAALDLLNAAVKVMQSDKVSNYHTLATAAKLVFDPENNDHDAATADFILQFAMFGEQVYA